MFFIAILALVTLAIAGCAAAFSVYGLASLFTGAFLSVTIMGASLEAGKLVAASFLYRYWKDLSVLMRTYLFAAIIILMGITSMGIFGFLSAGYQEDTLPLKEMESQISLFDEQIKSVKELKQERLDQLNRLDAQIDAIPGNHSTNRRKMRKAQVAERTQIDTDLKLYAEEIQKLLAEQHKVKSKIIVQRVHTGPVVYIAKVFGAEIDDATKYIIFALIGVFDPLAVVLTIGLNMAILKRKQAIAIHEGLSELEELKQKTSEFHEHFNNEILKYQELEEHLKYLNEQTTLSPEEAAEKKRIELLLAKSTSRDQIMKQVRAQNVVK